MIEIAMCICLTIMGIYFIKSTDLPKELRERSAQMKNEAPASDSLITKGVSLPPQFNVPSLNETQEDKLAKLNKVRKEIELKLYSEEIDKLTLTITALEQEIKVNNARNSEIQKIIDSHLIRFQLLQEKINALS